MQFLQTRGAHMIRLIQPIQRMHLTLNITGFILAFLLLLICETSVAQTLTGRVVGITDGDTFRLLTSDSKELKIRVAEIDAPERGQPYRDRSRQALSGLIFKKYISVEVQVVDRYGRYVGRPFVEDNDISAEMIRIGAAWVYRRYSKDDALFELERIARADKVGLWRLNEYERVAPWDWRNGEREKTVESSSRAVYQCGVKSHCREMVSCDEAKYYLRECSMTRLDGDGTPCEALCQ